MHGIVPMLKQLGAGFSREQIGGHGVIRMARCRWRVLVLVSYRFFRGPHKVGAYARQDGRARRAGHDLRPRDGTWPRRSGDGSRFGAESGNGNPPFDWPRGEFRSAGGKAYTVLFTDKRTGSQRDRGVLSPSSFLHMRG